MEFSHHALEKCTLYGVNPELVREALTVGETFLDLTPDDARVITVYLTDERTVQARRAGGRWLFLNR